MKSIANEYSEGPFFYTEAFEGAPRTIVWHNTVEGQKLIFHTIINSMAVQIEYLFKEDTQDESESNRWVRLFGGIYKSDLLKLIGKFEDWFFSDSIFQFCVREPEHEENFAYDEHGLFFIYENTAFEDKLIRLGINRDNKKLLTSNLHWHHRPKDSEESLKKFKTKLKELSVFFDEKAEQNGCT